MLVTDVLFGATHVFKSFILTPSQPYAIQAWVVFAASSVLQRRAPQFSSLGG